jgi:hypothetical protein
VFRAPRYLRPLLGVSASGRGAKAGTSTEPVGDDQVERDLELIVLGFFLLVDF